MKSPANHWLAYALLGIILSFTPLWALLSALFGWLDLTTISDDGSRQLSARKILPYFLLTIPGILLLSTAMCRHRFSPKRQSQH